MDLLENNQPEEQNASKEQETAQNAVPTAVEEPAAEAEPVENAQPQEEPQAEPQAEPLLTREALLEQLKAKLNLPVEQIKDEVEQLKAQFYHLCQEKQAQARQKAEQMGENMEEYQPVVDEIEEDFRRILTIYKQQKAEANAQKEAELQANLSHKEGIIAKMKALAESETADINGSAIQQMRDLQQEWKAVGPVPPTKVADLNKEYNACQEKFYDLVHINNELRELDFKKNLELKTKLCEQAEALKDKKEVVEAFRLLQTLHEQWANIGPVAREQREELWNRFKEASTFINKKHQDYFEELHRKEAENLTQKQALLEQLKGIDFTTLTTIKQWTEMGEKVNQLQAQWRSIGFAPKKVNQQIYEEYRALCDAFFAAKNAFFKQIKDEWSENLRKKKALLEQAESLQDSTDWAATTQKFVQLQKEWKQIGPVARKYSEDLWQRFNLACDHFFAAKKAQNQDTRSKERTNLDLKKGIIEQIENLNLDNKEEALQKLKDLMAQFNAVGFVPFKEKDALYKRFRSAADHIFDQLQIEQRNRRMDNFTKAVDSKDENVLLSERRNLVRQYEALKQEIKVAENNIGFFTSKSNKPNSLVEGMKKQIEQRKEQLQDIAKKIALIDSKLEQEQEQA